MTSRPAPWLTAAEPVADDLNSLDLSPPDSRALVHHPDGYYWLSAGGRVQIGPFRTAEEALAEMHRADDGDIEADESLPEAEQALGLADWLDPDTGGLAEATHTRLEEH